MNEFEADDILQIKNLEDILMSRYTGPSWKQSRRYGISLTGSGKYLETISISFFDSVIFD